MTRWLFVLLLAVAAPAGAIDCTDPNNDGLVCLMSDNATQGGCSGGACVRTYTIPGNAARTGTGTISSSGGAVVTGSGTAFTTQLHVGDVITASGQRVAVAAIVSDTSLSTGPAFFPIVTAATFTYTNPIVRWLDANGSTVAILDDRGFVAVDSASADGPMIVIGPTETGIGVAGKRIYLFGGTGGPADSTTLGGAGGNAVLVAGPGGLSSVAARNGGPGGLATYGGGNGGQNSATAGTGGAGGVAVINGGSGGNGTGLSGVGGTGANATVSGGAGGSGASGDYGLPGAAIVHGGRGGTGNNTYGDTVLCDNGGVTKIGVSAPTQIACSTGDVTKIKNVPVAGLWNVNAFQQANAGGM